MTNREFFTAVINGTVSANEIDFAKAEIAKLDARNDKRRNTLTKEQIANESIKSEMLAVLEGSPLVASEIAAKMGISTQKVSALAKQLVDCGSLKASDRKVKGKGTVKCYEVVA